MTAGWIGRTLSKVEIRALVGRGGMAEVYLGRHTTLNRPVAVKILYGHLSDDENLMARFRSEAQAVAGLRHPNIVQVLDFDVTEGQPYIVMEMLEGPSLDDYLKALRLAGKMPPPDITARLISHIAAALDYAHARGIVHRDVKPSNVLLRCESCPIDLNKPLPDDIEPVLTDFGVARLANATTRTASGTIVGTPAYMSPEQINGEVVDARSDIYSLGIMLYEMLAGRLPFESQSDTAASILIKHLTEPPPPLPNVPPAVQTVVFRALAKNRESRYQKTGDLAVDLKSALGLPVTPTELSKVTPPQLSSARTVISQRLRKPMIQQPRLSLTLGVLLVLLVLGGAAILWASGAIGKDKHASSRPSDLGALSFSGHIDQIDKAILSVTHFPPPPADKQYEAWLLGGETRRLIGTLTIDTTGNGQLIFTSETGGNLLASYDHFEITLEPIPDPNPLPTGEVVYSGQVPAGPLMHARHLLVKFSSTPGQIGLTIGILRDVDLIQTAAENLVEAQENGDQPEVLRQAEALINLIEGEGGAHFGDQDGDGETTDPGDGFGLLPNARDSGYIQLSIEHARYAANSPDATAGVKQNAASLEVAAQNLGGWAVQLRDLALTILKMKDMSPENAQQLATLADCLLNGQDINGNGIIEPIDQEGGAQTVYQYALHLADMPVTLGAIETPPGSPATPDDSMNPDNYY